jgi:hypothetical protein
LKNVLLVIGLLVWVFSCDNAIEIPSYDAIDDYQTERLDLSQDAVFVQVNPIDSTHVIMFYEAETDNITELISIDEPDISKVNLSWSGDGNHLFISFEYQFIWNRETPNSVYHYDFNSATLNKFSIIAGIVNAENVISNGSGDLVALSSSGSSQWVYYTESNTLESSVDFLERHHQLVVPDDYAFYFEDESNYTDNHAYFIRWDDDEHLILRKNFVRIEDQKSMSLLMKYRYHNATLTAVDSAWSVPDSYSFNSDIYFTFTDELHRVNKLTGHIDTLLSYRNTSYSIVTYYDLQQGDLLVHLKKRLTEWDRVNRFQVLDIDTKSAAFVLPDVYEVMMPAHDSANRSIVFTCVFDNRKVLIKTSEKGLDPVLVSNKDYDSYRLLLRPGIR